MPSNTTPPVIIETSQSDISDILLPSHIKEIIAGYIANALGGYNIRFLQCSKTGRCKIQSSYTLDEKEYILTTTALLMDLYEKNTLASILIELYDKIKETLRRIKDKDYTEELVYVKEESEPEDKNNRIFEMTVKNLT